MYAEYFTRLPEEAYRHNIWPLAQGNRVRDQPCRTGCSHARADHS